MRSRFQGLLAPLALAVLFVSMSPARASGGEPATVFTAPPADAVPVGSPLTLAEAWRLALAHNPELAMARLEVQALEGAEIQAGARPNPELGVLVEDTRSATRTTTVQWAQAIELGGKRSARLAAAASAREQAGVALLARQAELRAAVSSAFFELLGAQAQVRLSQVSLELARKVSGVASRRLQAGKVPPLEHAKAQVAEASARADLAQADSGLALARQRLRALWGPGAIEFGAADGNAQALPALPAQQQVGEWMADAPAVRLARLDIARRQALTEGERAKRVPDVTVTLGAKRAAELGRTQAVIGLSVPLPLLNRNEGNLLEALRREDQAREALAAATARLQSDVAQSLEKLRLSRDQSRLLRLEALPTATTAYEAAVKGYELGKFAFIEVLDAQRTLVQTQQQILRNTADAHRAAAELDRLLGRNTGIDGHSLE